jgi:aspartate aminotransferase
MMEQKSAQFGHTIFLISDEPYREIVFDGRKQPYPAKFYPHTLTCYSFSKSLSVPGERIGYVAVSPDCEQADKMVPMMGQISRGTGHNCPSSLPMLAAAFCLEDTSDLSVYETNMNLLYDTFKELGFTVPRPGGTFYIMPKALEDDAVAFCKKALKYDLVFVPGDGFKAPGFFRVAYCVDTEKVERALPAIRRFVEAEYPDR